MELNSLSMLVDLLTGPKKMATSKLTHHKYFPYSCCFFVHLLLCCFNPLGVMRIYMHARAYLPLTAMRIYIYARITNKRLPRLVAEPNKTAG